VKPDTLKLVALIPAGGASQRFLDGASASEEFQSSKPFEAPSLGKLLQEVLPGKSVFQCALEAISSLEAVAEIVVACREADRKELLSQVAVSQLGAQVNDTPVHFVDGGASRSESVRAALSHEVAKQAEYVLVHDAARPCLVLTDLVRVWEAAQESGAAILASRVDSTLKKGRLGGAISETIDRSEVFQAQTPQIFRRELLEGSYASKGDSEYTDEAMLVEQAGAKVTLVEGNPENIKVTRPFDLEVARLVLSRKQPR